MKLKHYTDIPLEEVNMDGAKGAHIVEPGGFTPYHKHEWEHENYIVSGTGVLVTEEGEKPFKPGDIIYVPPQFKHSYKNTGEDVLKFLCMIPNPEAVKKPAKKINPFAKGVANNC